jgi:DNA-directed RNA polymerase sigma subunit (sigma70/sigma32)
MTTDNQSDLPEQRWLYAVGDLMPELSQDLNAQHDEYNEIFVPLEDQLAILEPYPTKYHWFIGHRFGLFTGQPRTVDEMAELFDMTHEEVRLLEGEALASSRELRNVTTRTT